MNFIEFFFLDMGLSWTWSKLIPYLLSFILGLVFLVLLRKRIAGYKKGFRLFFQFFIFISFFVLYFSFYPIYEGDFTNSSIKIERTEENRELVGQKLVVLTIPGCRFCYESIGRMKELKKRNSLIEIEYLVCSEDENTIHWYKEEAGKDIKVSLAMNLKAMIELAKGSFPTFVLVNGKNELKVWSNSLFGVMAIDEVEEVLGKH